VFPTKGNGHNPGRNRILVTGCKSGHLSNSFPNAAFIASSFPDASGEGGWDFDVSEHQHGGSERGAVCEGGGPQTALRRRGGADGAVSARDSAL